jgi:adenosyl cobinamide kinase/adenosyl cobinamide phosphate guanylyltransferase
MAIDLLSLTPRSVSRDLSGYITFIYGPAKSGKTTFGSKMPGALLLAFERGYNAIPGIIAQDITTWGEMRQVMRELKKPEVKERFKSIIVDTADIAADLCQKYICSQLGIENIGDGGWATNGWAKYKKEFEDTFRTLTQLGYAVVFISHDKEKTISPQNAKEYQQIGSSMQSSALAIIENMSDIIGYAHPKVTDQGSNMVLTLRSMDNSIRCGCRFKYIQPEIDFTYEALTKALNEAIDKEAAETNYQYVTNERVAATIVKEYDFDALMNEFRELAGQLMQKSQTNGLKITQIVDKYLGKGKKVGDATSDQAELIYLIVTEVKEDLM